MNKQILKIAVPSILANITVPLLSIVDVAIAGHLGAVSNLCSVSVGTAVINVLYWTFGFLRMSTSGLTAQAFGAKDVNEYSNILFRSLLVSVCLTATVIVFKDLVQSVAFCFMQSSAEVEQGASDYLAIVIVGAPAVFSLFSFKGWFIGMQNSFFPMTIAISVNLLNVVFSVILAGKMGYGIKGIAVGSVLAQYFGLFLSVLLYGFKYRGLLGNVRLACIIDKEKLKGFFKLNGAIAIRTTCLTLVTTFFTFAGARQSETVLAVNTLLMQMFSIFSYFTDGFAYAGEALCGRFWGAKDKENYYSVVGKVFGWGVGLAVLFTIVYSFSTDGILSILTQDESVLSASSGYRAWVLAIPVCGFAAFIWDGIMVGSTMAKGMATSMVIATAVFFSAYLILLPLFGNNGLWTAFVLYLAIRGISQAIYFSYARKSFFS